MDRTSLADRLVAWINTDGIDHGDELERLRYLEGHAAGLALVQHLVPIVGAVAVLIAGRDSAWPVFAVVVVPAVGLQFALWYLRGQGVRVATHWLRTSNSRRYSLAACYTLFLGSMVAVGTFAPEVLVIMVAAQAVGFWASHNEALRQHDAEVAGADTTAHPGKRRNPSTLYLALMVLSGCLLVASLFLLSGEAFAASTLVPPAALFVLSAWMYRRERQAS
jgi:hypothetical protein